MKVKILFLVIFSLFFFETSVFSDEDWKKKLMDEGWVKVEKNLQEFANTTWYGLKSKYTDKNGFILYIHPDGLKISEIVQNSTYRNFGIVKLKRGQFCITWKTYKEIHCHTYWKKENIIMLVTPYGFKGSYFYGGKPTTWMVKKGNPENFK